MIFSDAEREAGESGDVAEARIAREARIEAMGRARTALGEVPDTERLYPVVEILLEILDDIIERKFV